MIVNKKSRNLFRIIVDLIILNSIFLFSAIAAQSFGILLQKDHMFILMILLNVVWYFTSNVISFYDDFYSKSLSLQFVNILKIVLVQTFTSIFFIFIVKEDLFTRNFIVYYSALLIVVVSIRTLIFKLLLKSLRRKGKNVRSLIIIGKGETGLNFEKMINENPDFGFKVKGFLDDYTIRGDDILGKVEELDNILSKVEVDEAVIALPDSAFGELDEIIRICNKYAVKVHIIPDYFRFMSKKFIISSVANFPIITVRKEPLDEVQWRIVKRFFDLLFTIIISTLLLWWLFPIIMIMIKLSSKGKVLFVQNRVGVKNKEFKCYKFRTMHQVNSSEDEFTPVIHNDPRITKIGTFLRKSNLDELPQFINVLLGDMSIVGPRPHAIAYHKKYGRIVEEIKLRHNVKPGITGWAQVHGLRGDVQNEEENTQRTKKRIQFDLWYIENWSIWLDIQIIILTIWQMIKRDTKGK
ncbi:MAG TPA: undecaprenyl-phosphate glucose phosphotransferase [Ignavibacteriaceae bacterium]|nr:undecaprenyl-phosphate glucose phosphotransferase [Ignavibacteriaceae bacterium]